MHICHSAHFLDFGVVSISVVVCRLLPFQKVSSCVEDLCASVTILVIN